MSARKKNYRVYADALISMSYLDENGNAFARPIERGSDKDMYEMLVYVAEQLDHNRASGVHAALEQQRKMAGLEETFSKADRPYTSLMVDAECLVIGVRTQVLLDMWSRLAIKLFGKKGEVRLRSAVAALADIEVAPRQQDGEKP